jgi:hypothetical protein
MRTRTRRVGLFVAVVLLLLLPAAPQAVGTVTITSTTASDVDSVRVSVAWVSDAAGNVNTNSFTPAVGQLVQIKFVPNGGGTAPTALYDIVLNDTDGVDWMAGAGANLSATVSTMVRPAAPLLYDGTQALDLVVTNAGVSKGGTVILWFQQPR